MGGRERKMRRKWLGEREKETETPVEEAGERLERGRTGPGWEDER